MDCAANVSQQYVEIFGTLTKAEIQKTKNIIGIRDDATNKVSTVHVPSGLMGDIVRPLWERRVRLTGERTASEINLLTIDAVDDDDSGGGATQPEANASTANDGGKSAT